MRYRSLTLLLCLAASLGVAVPVSGQAIRQVSLNTGTRQIDRLYLPANQTFDFLIRASGELREFRGEYEDSADGRMIVLEPWVRRDATKSRDATLRIKDLRPGATYTFTFILIRRPTGNEGRLIELGVQDTLRDTFRGWPDQPLDDVVALAAPGVKGALGSVLPRALPLSTSPLSGDPEALGATLEKRGIVELHRDYLRQLTQVTRLRWEFRGERRQASRAMAMAEVLSAIAELVNQGGGFAELRPPLVACQTVRDTSRLRGPKSIRTEAEQLLLLSTLKELDAALGTCRGLLRDVRLRLYARVIPPSLAARAGNVAGLLPPVADRLEALRSATERLMGLWRRREGTLGQVASDMRRALDTSVTVSDTIRASFATAPVPPAPPSTTLGVALLGTYAPCSLTTSCLRIVPAVTLGFQLSGLLAAEVGVTLADTKAPGRTQHLFWSTSGMAGLTLRLGTNRAQRLGAGALVLRQAEGSGFDNFKLGGYLSLTLYDFRI